MIILITMVMGALGVTSQLVKVFSTSEPKGVSSLTWFLIACTNWGWAAFFASTGTSWASVAMFIFGVGALFIATRVTSNGSVPQVLLGGSAAVVTATLVLWTPFVAISVVAIISAFMFIPQMLRVLSNARSNTPTNGVSRMTWVWNALISVAWIGTSLQVGAVAAMVANVFLLICCVAIILVITSSENKRSSTALPGEQIPPFASP